VAAPITCETVGEWFGRFASGNGREIVGGNIGGSFSRIAANFSGKIARGIS
jgi:hypothetical protein